MRLPWRFFVCLAVLALIAVTLVSSGVPSPRIRAEAAPAPPEIVVLGVGDILLGRQLGEEMERARDYSIAFRDIRETLAAADITFGNLEGPFCDKGPYPANGMIFRFRPAAVFKKVRGRRSGGGGPPAPAGRAREGRAMRKRWTYRMVFLAGLTLGTAASIRGQGLPPGAPVGSWRAVSATVKDPARTVQMQH